MNFVLSLGLRLTVADPGFPRRGAPTSEEAMKTYYLAIFFCQNCMKIKEVGARVGVRVPGASPGSANGYNHHPDTSLNTRQYNATGQCLPLPIPRADAAIFSKHLFLAGT